MRKDFKAEYDRNGAFTGYKETGRVVATVDGKPEQLAEMDERLLGAFAMPSVEQVEEWLVELSLLAPRRADGDGNDLLRIEAYASRLREYPADVAREALLGRVWRFWPSWFELHEVCEELTAHRRAVCAAVDRAIAEREERELRARALPTEQTTRPTAEEAAAAQARTDAARKATVQFAGDIIASMTAKAAEQQAARAAALEEAANSYAPFRGGMEAAE